MNNLLRLTGILFCIVAVSSDVISAEPEPSSATGTTSMAKMNGPGGRRAGARDEFDGRVLERMVNSPRIIEKIGLSDEQVQTLRQVAGEIGRELDQIKTERQKLALEQARLMLDATLDEVAIMANVEKLGKLQTDMAKAKMRQLIVLRKTLTPEQMSRMKEIRKRLNEARADGGEKERRGKRMERAGQGDGSREPAAGTTNAVPSP